jgi:hypothetical protein
MVLYDGKTSEGETLMSATEEPQKKRQRNNTYTPCTLDLEVGSETRDPFLPLRTAIVFELEPFMAPYFRCTILQWRYA